MSDTEFSRYTSSPPRGREGPSEAGWHRSKKTNKEEWSKAVRDGKVTTIIGTDFLGDGDPEFKEREPPGVHGTKVALNHPTSMEWNPVTGRLLLPRARRSPPSRSTISTS